jgi:uncharacterized protein with NAD-binding domain and iron-sulfur cluster
LPQFYKHVIDAIERIPYGGPGSVADNLVDTTGTIFARFGRRSLKLPTVTPRSMPELFAMLTDFRALSGAELGISSEEFAFFGERIWQILTSCSERRMDEYEKRGWWEFIGAEQRSDDYQKLFGIGFTRSVVAALVKLASTKTIDDMFVQYFFDLAEPGISADRVLNGPTNDVWTDPWPAHLRGRGVNYQLDTRVRSIEMDGGVVRGVTVEQDRTVSEARADYYVSALPVEAMAPLVTDRVVRADPGLADIIPLSENTDWMKGIQFYLDDDAPIGPGHQIYIDSPWALTSVSQAQFWPDVDLSRFGDGSIRGAISVVISDWDTLGLNGKSARECTRREIRDEVWDQPKRSLNVEGADVLEDEDLVHWFLDLAVDPLLKTNAESLFVNLVDTWRLRPRAVTAIPNLFLAADYVQTSTDLATMEAASEAARRAVNGILEHSGSDAPPCRLWDLHEPVLLKPWRANDRGATGRVCRGTTPPRSSGCRRWQHSTAGSARSRRRSWTRSARRCTSRTCCPTSGRGRAGRSCSTASPPNRERRPVSCSAPSRRRHGRPPAPLSRSRPRRWRRSPRRAARCALGSRRAEERAASASLRSPDMTAVWETAGIERQLAHYRDLTYRALLEQLPSREPRRYLYDLISGQLSHAGKSLRPALCIATCRAFGGSTEQALPSAVSIELLHNAFLVHDDIEDASLYRRNEAAMYVEEGIPIAINVGDAMNVLSHRLVDREHPRPGCRPLVPGLPRGAAPHPPIGRGPGAGARVDARQRLRPD